MNSFKLAFAVGVPLFAGLVPSAAAVDGAKRIRLHSLRTADAYVVTLGDRKSFLSLNVSVEEIEALQGRFSGDFLWVRRAKTTSIVRDPATLQEARALFDPLKTLDPDREVVRSLRAPIESRQRELDREQEDLEREAENREADDDSGRPVGSDELHRKQRAVEERMRDLETEEKRVDSLENALEQKEEALERSAEAELWRLIDASIGRGLAKSIEKTRNSSRSHRWASTS